MYVIRMIPYMAFLCLLTYFISTGNHPGVLTGLNRSSSSSISDNSPTEIHPIVHNGKNKKRKKVKGNIE